MPKALVALLLVIATALFGSTDRRPQYTITLRGASAHNLESRFNERQIEILEKLNRSDRAHLSSLPRLVLPQEWDLDELDYSPLPARYNLKSPVTKLLVVHLPSQLFAAYKKGQLVRWGPVSSGGIHSPTPPGLYHLNWRSPGRCSSVNPDWYMRWYFNYDNSPGLAFHEYVLPGKPESHGCVRLLQRDAKWLYKWGQGVASCEPDEMPGQGTTVSIVGSYNYGAHRRGIPTIGGRVKSHFLVGRRHDEVWRISSTLSGPLIWNFNLMRNPVMCLDHRFDIVQLSSGTSWR